MRRTGASTRKPFSSPSSCSLAVIPRTTTLMPCRVPLLRTPTPSHPTGNAEPPDSSTTPDAVSLVTDTDSGQSDADVPTREEIQEELDAFVARHNRCGQSADCVVVEPGCPLHCFLAVRADAAEATRAKAHELLLAISPRIICDNDCAPTPHGECVSGRCSVCWQSGDPGCFEAPR